MRVIKNYIYNASYQVFVLLVPLITTPYLSRVLGPTGVGINAYTNSIIQYFILFGSIGINLYGNRQIAFVRENKKLLSNVFFEIFFLRILTIGLSCIAFVLFLTFSNKYHDFYLAQFLSLIAAAFDISWFFMGMENFAVTVLRNLVVKICTLISIFIFVKNSDDLVIYILILSLSLLFGNLTLFPNLHRYISLPRWRSLRIMRHVIPAFAMFIPQIATQIYLVVNKTMLGTITSVQAAGYFDQSDKIIKMVLAIVTATGTVMLPHVANAFSKGHQARVRQYLYASFEFVTAIAVPMFFGIIAVTAKFVPLFFTTKFNAVIPLMRIESLVIILIAWSNVIGTQYLLPTKQTRSFTISVVMGAVVNIIVNFPLIILLGATGTAIATVLSEAIVTGYQVYLIRKQVKISRLFLNTGKIIGASAIMGLVVFIADSILPTSWVMLGIEVIIGMITYLLCLIIFRVEVLNRVKSIINNFGD